MKNLFRIIGLTLLLLLFSLIWPAWWWILFLPVVFMTFAVRKLLTAFGNAFIAGLLAWGITAIIQFSSASVIITNKMATLFGLPGGIFLLIAVILIAGIIAGFAGMTGAALRALLFKEKRDYYY